MSVRWLAALAAVASLCLAAAAGAARVGHQTTRAGALSADLSYVRHPNAFPQFTKLRLTVRDAGRVVYDRPVRLRGEGGPGLQPGALAFRDLDADGRKELLLDLFTGGAHCCFVLQVLDFSSGQPQLVQKDFGDPGERVEFRHGQVVLISANDAFAYRFTAFVASGLPIQVWTYRAGRFHDVTRSFPNLVGADARVWWGAYLLQRRRHGEVRGVLSAWAADQALLGRAAAARVRIARIGPRGYAAELWRFLGRQGYLG